MHKILQSHSAHMRELKLCRFAEGRPIPESHSAHMRELKYFSTVKFYSYNRTSRILHICENWNCHRFCPGNGAAPSHSAHMRELKWICIWRLQCSQQSHPTHMRELKLMEHVVPALEQRHILQICENWNVLYTIPQSKTNVAFYTHARIEIEQKKAAPQPLGQSHPAHMRELK